MTDEKPFNKQHVAILSGDSKMRQTLGRAFRKDDYKAHFIDSPKQLTEIFDKFRPATFIHDWPTFEPSIAIKFHQKMAKISPYSTICRVIYAQTLSPSLAALAVDCGLRRVISRATPPTGLVSEITMALASLHQMPELQQLIHKLHTGVEYDQEAIDQNIEKAHRYYAHDPLVRLEYANLLFRRKYYQIAKSIATALLEENPNNVRAINLLSRLLAQEGNLNSAAAILEEANIISPYNIDRLVQLGDVFFALGNNPKAGNYYQEALALDPHDPKPARTGLAQVHLRQGEINTALEIIGTSLSEEESASLFNNAAVHAARIGRIEASLKLYRSAIKILHSSKLKSTVYFNLAVAYDRVGRPEDSMKAVIKSLEFDPSYEKARRHKSRLERRTEKKAS